LIIINYDAFSGRLVLSRKIDTIKHLTFPIAAGIHGIYLIVTTLWQSVSKFMHVNVQHHTSREMFNLLVTERRAGLGFYIKITINKTSHNLDFSVCFHCNISEDMN